MTGPIFGQGGLRAAPAQDDPLIEAIRKLLPERTQEERDRGIVKVAIGSDDASDLLVVPVLSHAHNEAWKERASTAGRKLIADLQGDDTGTAMLNVLLGQLDLMLDLLEAYSPVLLNRQAFAERATDEQILDAFLKVTAAAYPSPVALARVLLANKQVAEWVRLMIVQALYSASLQPSTATPTTPSTTS